MNCPHCKAWLESVRDEVEGPRSLRPVALSRRGVGQAWQRTTLELCLLVGALFAFATAAGATLLVVGH